MTEHKKQEPTSFAESQRLIISLRKELSKGRESKAKLKQDRNNWKKQSEQWLRFVNASKRIDARKRKGFEIVVASSENSMLEAWRNWSMERSRADKAEAECETLRGKMKVLRAAVSYGVSCLFDQYGPNPPGRAIPIAVRILKEVLAATEDK